MLALLERNDDLHAIDFLQIKLAYLIIEFLQLLRALFLDLRFGIECLEQLLFVLASIKGFLCRDKHIECLCEDANEVDLVQLIVYLSAVHRIAHAP